MIPYSIRPLVLALTCLFPFAALGQEEIPAAPLKPSTDLVEGKKAAPTSPVFLEADQLEGQSEKNMKATGNVKLRRDTTTIHADHVDYTDPDSTAIATGNVVIDKEGDVTRGPFLKYNLETEEGYMETPTFTLAKKDRRKRESRGDASKIDFEGPDKDRLFDVRYTTCSEGNNDWYLRAKELELDRTTQIGKASHASIIFKDVPILYSPFLDFPLNGQRKSGFLAPSLGSNGKNGLIIDAPYYWNIAPNYDDTITPRVLSKRGLQIGNEFRYLQRSYYGQLDTEYLPNDQLANKDRYLGRWRHEQTLIPNMYLTLDLQKVSDNDYFRDLSSKIVDTSQTYLSRDGFLSYKLGNYWSAYAHMLRYQPLTLNGDIPYALGPQVVLNGDRGDVYGFELHMHNEWTSFEHPTQVNGERTIVYPTVSYPMRRSYGYITPKLGYHSTQYTFTENNTSSLPNIDRNLPIASLDSALYFDRNLTLGEKSYTNTLEPRLFYVKVPYRDQTRIPNFATSELDFGFAQIFSENPFIGGDRIADANHITMGATSRLIDSENGIERIRAVLAQRYYFTPQRVTLTGSPQTDKRSDLLLGLSGQVTNKISLDSAFQYNADQGRTEKYSVGIRYDAGQGKIINVSRRFTRDSSNQLEDLNQIDISTQWPINRNWYGLGRVNYSLHDRRLVEGIAGLEYNRDCWALRMVAHRFPITSSDLSNATEQRTTTSFFIQLELTGLSPVGINPLETLKQNIPGYTKSTEIAK